MVRRLCMVCFLVALWPGLALAQSAALMEAFNQYQALDAQGRYAEAEPFARKALELSQREFGPDHPTTANILNNLASLYYAQGRYAEAEPRRIRVPEMPIALRPRLPTLGRQSIRGFRELCTKGFLDSAAQPPIPGFRPGLCHTVAAARAASGLANDGWALYGTDIVAPTSRSPSRRSQLSRLREAPEGNLE